MEIKKFFNFLREWERIFSLYNINIRFDVECEKYISNLFFSIEGKNEIINSLHYLIGLLVKILKMNQIKKFKTYEEENDTVVITKFMIEKPLEFINCYYPFYWEWIKK